MVPRRGLEPPRLAALVPETSASTNSAIWADSKAGVIQAPERGIKGLDEGLAPPCLAAVYSAFSAPFSPLRPSTMARLPTTCPVGPLTSQLSPTCLPSSRGMQIRDLPRAVQHRR